MSADGDTRTWRVTVTRNGGEIIGYQDVPYPAVQQVIDGWRPLAGTYGWTVAAQPLADAEVPS